MEYAEFGLGCDNPCLGFDIVGYSTFAANHLPPTTTWVTCYVTHIHILNLQRQSLFEV